MLMVNSFSPEEPSEGIGSAIPTLQVRKLRLREAATPRVDLRTPDSRATAPPLQGVPGELLEGVAQLYPRLSVLGCPSVLQPSGAINKPTALGG